MLLQILEDGSLTDAKGRKVDFTNTIIILTSNLGAEKMQKEAAIGFRANSNLELGELSSVHQQNREAATEELKHLMRPELINRLDKIIVFKALTKPEAQKILDLQLAELSRRLSRKGIGVTVAAPAKKILLEKGYDASNGVRPLRRIIQDMIEDEIADGLLDERYNKGDIIRVTANKGGLVFTPTAE